MARSVKQILEEGRVGQTVGYSNPYSDQMGFHAIHPFAEASIASRLFQHCVHDGLQLLFILNLLHLSPIESSPVLIPAISRTLLASAH